METIAERCKILSPCTIWLTGLSGAGKTTIAEALKKRIDEMTGSTNGTFVLDGDVVRQGLNKDLGFSAEDRTENIRRICEVSKLFALSGKICISSFISPYEKDRAFGKEIHEKEGLNFFEGYISASLEVCEGRDIKGLYKKAREGIIPNFTGVSDPYEVPENPDINIPTGDKTIQECVQQVIEFLANKGVLSAKSAYELDIEELYDLDDKLAEEAEELESIKIDEERIQFLHVLADGWAGKLKNFMNETQLLESLHYNTVTADDGEQFLQSVPITCHLTTEEMEKCQEKERIALRHKESNMVLAIIEKPTFFANRKEEISARVFGTLSKEHPKIQRIFEEGDYLVSGERLRVLSKITYEDGLDEYRLSPTQIMKIAQEKGADCIYGFQLRNPLHSGHVMLLNSTRDKLIERGYANPLLLLHPCGGWTKDDDVPLNIRMEQHQALISDGELSESQTILAIWPSPMFYAGPTEVLWHVASRLNAGVNYFIVGRDPAGIGHPELEGENLYDPFHGQKVLDLGKDKFHRTVEIMPFKVAAYNKVEKKMAFFDPSKAADFEFISGSKMRKLARDGETPPDGFMNPKGWEVLSNFYKSLSD
ncbi:unnamed protein product [Moneuplotes crassus]|uniref:Uncharacterized protein n=3 Tax=Euplotes crassus TaxID=5936 RepID=A0AAD1U3U6_EUPCR|nr:unnamed protein product [Moneuplotes crassus]